MKAATDRQTWMTRQKLPGKAASVVDAVRSGGWIHTAGGTGAYVAMHARVPGFKRSDLDRAAFVTHELLELPSVRDSTMLVPRVDAGVALAAGRRAFDARLKAFARACEVTRHEIDRLADSIADVLTARPLTSEQIHDFLPPRLVRDLGKAGQKLGSTTTLPLALRMLQVTGRALRVPEDERIDAKGYGYVAWPKSIRADEIESDDEIDKRLAHRFAAWASPATTADLAWWANLPKRRASAAAEVAEPPAGSRAESRGVALLPFRDNYLYLRRGLLPLVDDPSGLELLDWNGKPVPIERLDSLHTNAITVDGELRGIWEWDPDRGEVAWRTLRREKPATKSAIERSVAALESFVRDELGDHCFYPFDTSRTRAPRIAFARG